MKVAFYPDDRANPVLGILAEGLAAQGAAIAYWRNPLRQPRADVIHVHWAESVAMARGARRSLLLARLMMRRFEGILRRHRRTGGRVVWTAHNLRPHEADTSPRGRMVTAALARIYAQADAVVCMSDASAHELASVYPTLADRARIIRHPSYAGHFGGLAARPEQLWHDRLGLAPAARLMTLAGLVRRYKRIVETIRAFDTAALPDTVLVIAGACHDPAYEAEVTEAAARAQRVVFRSGRLDEPDFHALLRESAYILVPQDKAQNSGTLIAALSAGTPAIASATTANNEIAALVGAGWVTTFETLDAASLAGAVGDADGAIGQPDLAAYDPSLVARQHLEIYHGG